MSRKPRLKPLSRQTIVITGATSGIGLATARRAAKAGACVFLIARSENDLKALCEEIQAAGGRCAYAVADVADHEALAEAAENCIRLFGGYDTWVNNAGVSIYGPIRETTLEDHRRLFDTNYWGVVNGSIIAVEHLRARPGGGTVINVGSSLSDAPFPVQGLYAASKHAVKGFTNSLRIEMLRERAPIHVSLVKPAAVDTPYPQHARNLTGEAVRNPQPVYAAHVVADAILHCATHSTREITVGGSASALAAFYSMFPGVAEPLLARFGPSMMRDRRADYQTYDDGLYDPTEDGLYEEVHYPMVRQSSLLAQARMHPGVTGGGLALIALAGVAAVLLTQRSGPTRYERLRSRVDPRNWRRQPSMGDRLGRWTDRVRDDAEDWGGRAAKDARRWFDRAADAFPADEIEAGARKTGRMARDGAVRTGRFAKDHAREGGAILALATIAAAVGAAAIEHHRAQDR
ncbi:MAG: SDR family oxidoreductase [Brevundimonas sp.]|uniref:SDR family oxidoreductase n=1 Tax=Brevundimonas sp. TaxID=1871086 RepID=UPI00391A81D8